MKKRILALILSVLLMMPSVVITGRADDLTTRTSIDVQMLFQRFPQHIDYLERNSGLPRDIFLRANEVATDAATGASAVVASFMSVLDFKSALEAIFTEVIEPGGKDRQEQWRDVAAEELFLAVAQTAEIADMSEVYNEIYNTEDDIISAIEDVSTVCDYLSKKEVEQVFNATFENSEAIWEAVGAGVDMIDYALTITALYEANMTILDTMIARLERTSSATEGELVRGLYQLRSDMSNDPATYIIGKYLLEDAVVSALAEIIVYGVAEAFPLTKIVNIGLKTISAIYSDLLQLPTAEDITKALSLGSFCDELGAAISWLQIDIITAANNNMSDSIDEEIQAYEILYNAYFTALCQFSEAAKAMANEEDEYMLDSYLSTFKQYCTYDQFLVRCISAAENNLEPTTNEQAIQAKIDELYRKLTGKLGEYPYFTVYGTESCTDTYLSNHGCANCYTKNIVKQKWFQELFGSVSVDWFPYHYGNGTTDYSVIYNYAKSCAGFASFAEWYIFSESSKNGYVSTANMGTYSFTYQNMKNYVRPGDILRSNTGHSVIVYSISDTYITVLDCNNYPKNYGNCLVQKKIIRYSDGWKDVTVSRSTTPYCNHSSGWTSLGICLDCCVPFDFETTRATDCSGVYQVSVLFASMHKSPYIDDEIIKMAPLSVKIKVLFSVENARGELWYYCSYNNVNGYIKASSLKYASEMPYKITFLGLKTPRDYTMGKSWWVVGTIKSTYNITSVIGTIINVTTGETVCTTPKGTPDKSTPTEYLLKGSVVDSNLKFGKLPAGSYYYTITATDSKGHTKVWESDIFQVTAPTKTTCGTPVFTEESIAGGKKVTISSSTAGATISWSYDGKSGSGKSPVTLTLYASQQITATASKSGMNSSIDTRSVTVSQCVEPEISAGMISAQGMQVVITAESGQRIHYSVNGKAYQEYSEPFFITETSVIRAYAEKEGFASSGIMMETLTFEKPSAPALSLMGTKQNIAQGNVISVMWDKASNATGYAVNIYLDGELLETKQSTAAALSFPADQAGVYQVTVTAYNVVGSSAESNAVSVAVHAPKTVVFTHEDGTTLSSQTVDYGGTATAPAVPGKTGHTFVGWSRSLDNITEDCTISAEFEINVYTIRYYDCDGKTLLGMPHQVEYGGSIDPSRQDLVSLATGYSFVGWHIQDAASDSRLDLNFIDCDMTLVATQQWEIGDLPIVVSIVDAVRNENCTGYDVELSLTCAPTSVIGGNTQKAKIIVTLKSEDDQMLAAAVETVNLTESQQDLTRSVFVSYDGSYLAATVEVSVVGIDGNDRTGGALAETVSAEPRLTTSWSEWTTEKPEGADYETKTQYRYTDYTRSTTSEVTTATDISEKSGWTLVSTTWEWGNWSNWSDTPIAATDNREVKTQQVQVSAAYTQYRYGRWYTSMSPKYGKAWWHFCKELAIDRGIGTDWTLQYSDWSTTQTSPTSTNNWWCSTLSHNHVNPNKSTSSTDYWNTYKVDGKTYYWEENRTVAAIYKTQYAYRDKIYTYTYEKWNEGTTSEWSDTACTAYTKTDSKRVVETRTLYRYITNDTTVTPLDTVTQSYSFEGRINSGAISDCEGKLATVLVYKQTNSDPTEPQLEYVGETIIGADNSFSFSIRPKETPTAATGDFIVALALQGSSNVVNVAKIMAPAEEYTVSFYDYDGTVLDAQSVTEGGNATAPVSPVREGYQFVCWSTDLTDVRRDLSVHAVYIPEKYSVVFVDFENRTLALDTDYAYGAALLTPGVPVCEGMVFEGWQVTYNSTGETVALTDYTLTITDDLIVSAMWTPMEYEVTFLDQDGNVLETQTVYYGQAAELPEYTNIPDGMVFLGWSTENIWWNVTCNMEVYPVVVYEETTTAPMPETYESTGVMDTIELTSEVGAVIYYTVDGSDPEPGTENTFVYSEPIFVDVSTEIRAIAVKENKNASEIISVAFWYMDELEEFSVDDTLVIGTYNIEAIPGSTVQMQLNIENNPGLMAFLFYVDADTNVFSIPVDAETGEVSCQVGAVCSNGTLLVAPYEDGMGWPVLWFGTAAATGNGTLCTIDLLVAEDAEPGTYPITVRYSPANTFDEEYISQEIPGISTGFSGATEFKMGDVDGDGSITNKDVVLIARWIIGAAEIAEERQFLIDVNADGQYTVADVLHLSRYVIGLEHTLGGLG